MIVHSYGRFADTGADVATATTAAGGFLATLANIFHPGSASQTTPVKPAGSGFPTTIALVGGGILVAGIAAYALKKSRR